MTTNTKINTNQQLLEEKYGEQLALSDGGSWTFFWDFDEPNHMIYIGGNVGHYDGKMWPELFYVKLGRADGGYHLSVMYDWVYDLDDLDDYHEIKWDNTTKQWYTIDGQTVEYVHSLVATEDKLLANFSGPYVYDIVRVCLFMSRKLRNVRSNGMMLRNNGTLLMVKL